MSQQTNDIDGKSLAGTIILCDKALSGTPCLGVFSPVIVQAATLMTARLFLIATQSTRSQ